jgi:hypothetical protein
LVEQLGRLLETSLQNGLEATSHAPGEVEAMKRLIETTGEPVRQVADNEFG